LLAEITNGRNDLEGPAIELEPAIAQVLAVLRNLPGCRLARMSGSGATCFGLFDSTRAASAAARTLRVGYPAWWTRATVLGGLSEGAAALVRAADADLDGLFQRLLHRRGRKQSERVGGDRTIVPCALDGVFERAVLHHQADRMLEVGVGRVPLLERAPPERPFALRSAAERQHHRQRDLALAKVVPGVLAELGRLAAVVEGVIHELEGDTEVHPERAAGVLLVFGARGERRTDLAGGGEELCGLGANDREVVILGGGGVLGGAELHHLSFGDD